MEQLVSTIDNVVLPPAVPIQGFYPSLRFTCNGILTRLIYSTVPEGAAEEKENEVFHIWRENASNPGIANFIPPPQSRADEAIFREINANISLYSLDLNLTVEANDFLGLFAARFSSLLFLQSTRANSTAVILTPLITAIVSRKYIATKS